MCVCVCVSVCVCDQRAKEACMMKLVLRFSGCFQDPFRFGACAVIQVRCVHLAVYME